MIGIIIYMYTQKVWFAKKINGDIITLTEEEAITHFEQNQIASRMRLEFLGTSDGAKYNAGQKKVQEMVKAKLDEEYSDFMQMDKAGRAMAERSIRESNIEEIRALLDTAFNDELEVAKANGIERPDATVRIKTAGGDRNKILDQMSSMK